MYAWTPTPGSPGLTQVVDPTPHGRVFPGRPANAAHTPIGEVYRAEWAIPSPGKLPGGGG